MGLRREFDILPGITTVIGSGGKTTLLRMLGEELAMRRKRVILTTTTHILPFAGMPQINAASGAEVEWAFENGYLICCGIPQGENGKLAAPGVSIAELAKHADYVLVEGDGSRQLPLKAHGPQEPVIPPESGQVICVVGLSGIGRPIAEVCHRPELYAWLAGAREEEDVTPQMAAQVLEREHLASVYLLNQADTPEREAAGEQLGRLLRGTVHIGSLQKGFWRCLL